MTNLKFEIIGDMVTLSIQDFYKLLKIWKKEGAIIKSDQPIPKK